MNKELKRTGRVKWTRKKTGAKQEEEHGTGKVEQVEAKPGKNIRTNKTPKGNEKMVLGEEEERVKKCTGGDSSAGGGEVGGTR